MMYRCSQLDQLASCPQSGNVELRVSRHYDATNEGSAAHEVMRAWAEGHPDISSEVDAQANAYGVKPGTVGMMFWTFKRAVDRLPDVMRNGPQCELHFQSAAIPLTGHIDWLVVDGHTAYVIDMKTGRIDYGHEEQMKGYAHLVFQNNPDCRTVATIAIYCRSGHMVTTYHHRHEQEAYVARMRRLFEEDEYNVGKTCAFCPRKHSCPALREVLGDPDGWSKEGSLAEQYDHARVLESIAADVKEAVRAMVSDEDVPTERGTVLGLRPTQTTEIDTAIAMPILIEKVGHQEAISVSKLTKTAINSALRGHVNKAEREAFWQDLNDAGACIMKTTHRFGEYEPVDESNAEEGQQ